MGRIFKNLSEAVPEMFREVQLNGQTVQIKHYQNRSLGDDVSNITKEIINPSFTVLDPHDAQSETEALEYAAQWVPEDTAEMLKKYVVTEIYHRVADLGEGKNQPESAYEARPHIWEHLVNRKGKYDYTYRERYGNHEGLRGVLTTLLEDPGTRRAVLSVWDNKLDNEHRDGCETRIPCSMFYQFLIRNGKLEVVYNMRSNDLIRHFTVDLVLTARLCAQVSYLLGAKGLLVKPGALHYHSGSLHAYEFDYKHLKEF